MGIRTIFDFMGKKVDLAEIKAIAAGSLEQLEMKRLALFIGVSYIANTLSKCEIKTYINGKEEKDEFYYRLNISPNPNENSSQFINKFIERYFYKGDALLIPYGDSIFCADEFSVDETNPLEEFVYKDVRFGNNTLKSRSFNANEVFYFKLDNKNVKKLLDDMYAQYGQIVDLAMKTFRKTNGKKYKLLLNNYAAGDPKFKQEYEEVIKKQLQTFMENDNVVYPQFKGQSLEDISTGTPKDTSDIIAMRKEIFEIYAQALKIPISMMLGNITNMNEIVKIYLTVCIDPLADMIGEEITRKRFSFDQWKKGCYCKVDTSCINHVDILEIADKVEKILGCGALNIDDVRERINMPTLGTEFSTSYFLTKNFDLAQNVLKSAKGGE